MFLTSFFDQILETGSFIEVEFRDKRCLSEFFGAFKQAITVTKQGGCNLENNYRVTSDLKISEETRLFVWSQASAIWEFLFGFK